MRRIRERLRTEMRSLRGTNAQAVIRKLNPIIRGWAAYYRTQVSSEAFDALDNYLWRLTCKWARYSHPNKPKPGSSPGTTAGSTSPGRTGGCSATATSGAYLHKFAWTRILRHQMVTARSVPRRPRPGRVLGQATAQGTAPADRQDQPAAHQSPGRSLPDLRRSCCCPPMTGHRTHASGNTGWPPPARRSQGRHAGRTARRTRPNPVSYTPTCRNTAARPGTSATPTSHQGLLEPDAVKPARPVLRGAGHSNAPGPTRHSRKRSIVIRDTTRLPDPREATMLRLGSTRGAERRLAVPPVTIQHVR